MRYGKRRMLLPAAAALLPLASRAAPLPDDGPHAKNFSFSSQEIEDGLHFYQTTLERPIVIDTFGDPSIVPPDQLLFLAPHDGGLPDVHSGALIATPTGEPVWSSSAYGKVHDLLVQPYGPDQAPHLTFWAGSRQSAAYSIGKGHGVVLDDKYSVVARVLVPDEAGSGDIDLHEFRLSTTPEGRQTALLSTMRTVASPIGTRWGPYVIDTCVYEIDIELGTVVWYWCPADHLSPDDSYQIKLILGFSFSSPYDFFHLNSVEKDALGNYLISGRCMHALFLVSPQGEVIWTLGGHAAYGQGDFAVVGDGDVSFGWQHHSQWVPELVTPEEEGQQIRYISLFDNGNSGFKLLSTRSSSRGLILRIDEAAMTVSLHGSYPCPPALEGDASSSQGATQRLASGDVFVAYGKRPWYAFYTPAGEMRFSGRMALEAETYRGQMHAWRGTPAYPPQIGVYSFSDPASPARMATEVYVTWNGATEVAAYRLFGGAEDGDLAPLLDARKAGFETVLRVPHPAPAWLAVGALSANGTLLSTSDAHASDLNSTLPRLRAGAPGSFGPPDIKPEWSGKIEPMGSILFLVQRWAAGVATKLGLYR